MSENAGETGQNPNQAFFEKAERSLRELFDRAQAAYELHFAMALMPEFRGEQDAGWSTADESVRAYDEFAELVRSLPKNAGSGTGRLGVLHACRRGSRLLRDSQKAASDDRGARQQLAITSRE
jgi:hypothetical protein